MAQILAVGHFSNLTENNYQSLFNLHQAVDVFLGFKNYHNAGACYMNLGHTASIEFNKAKEYMEAAIAL
jgi:hypothetical protein